MIAGWRDRAEDASTATCRREAVRLAQRVRTLDGDLAANWVVVTELVRNDTPQLLELAGVEAAMASLAGTCPIPASSGNTTRHRLNRALTTITIVRMRVDPATRAYVARRRAEGHTTKEPRHPASEPPTAGRSDDAPEVTMSAECHSPMR